MHQSVIIISNSEPECSGTDVRLVDSATLYDGIVQICHNGFWGSICGYGWDDIDASIACRQLGLSPAGSTAIPIARSFQCFNVISGAVGGVDLSFSSNAPIVLDVVTCNGSEKHLIDCGHIGLGVHYCSSFDGEAFVLCTGIKCMMIFNSNVIFNLPHHL